MTNLTRLVLATAVMLVAGASTRAGVVLEPVGVTTDMGEGGS